MQDIHYILVSSDRLHTTSIAPYNFVTGRRSKCGKGIIKHKEKTRRKRRVLLRSAMRGAEAAFSKPSIYMALQDRFVNMYEFSQDELHHLPNVLSAPRFATYLQTCQNDREDALQLYLWNLKVSAALMVPLHVVEVTLRNAVVEAIETVHGGTWPWSAGFLRSLPNPKRPHYSPQSDLALLGRKHPTSGKIIADLKFVFWERMLTKRHDERLWAQQFATIFSNAPTDRSMSELRQEVHTYVNEVRELRNRIAHHEPIFSRDLRAVLGRMDTIVRWRNRETADWMEKVNGTSQLLNSDPRRA